MILAPRVRFRAFVQILLVTCVVCFAPGAHAARSRCDADALDEWYCALDPRGSAVLDKLGRVVCAPGSCVKDEEEGWVCSFEPGGAATWVPEGGGPVCDGECREPEATYCKKV
jgi:hypothetical protein